MPNVFMPRYSIQISIKLRIKISKGRVLLIFPEMILSRIVDGNRMNKSHHSAIKAIRKVPAITQN
ncbi:hypothetical protein MA16_Dca027598 [Dendrobium catenatum]|uniref:Uncharacterized protein n=1 Tax=Dendrobium catenatum TaxID=906689 RepID=A0A2I0WA01_9ASPA|nr:hypothetical protein MA16_Dca027598 [Dendrobium catenatum]